MHAVNSECDMIQNWDLQLVSLGAENERSTHTQKENKILLETQIITSCNKLNYFI